MERQMDGNRDGPIDSALIPALLERALEEHREVIFAYLFGSFARQSATLQSDIDVAVYLTEGVDPLEARLELIDTLTRQLHTEDIDVIILNSAPLSLVGRILTHRVVLLDRDPHLRHRYESLRLRQFQDFTIKERNILERRFGLGRH